SAALRDAFSTAWDCLPADVRRALAFFIRQVRDVQRLSGARIVCAGGEVYSVKEDGRGFCFFQQQSRQCRSCDILFSTELGGDLATAVGVSLHELAHAEQYRRFGRRVERMTNAESDAWGDAALWASQISDLCFRGQVLYAIALSNLAQTFKDA